MNRLLIVDDALIMRMKIRELAIRAGWDVVAEGSNGVAAVSLYELHSPDLVTLDMVMPEMDGLEALKAIRLINPNAQIVMVSAVNQKEKLRECIAAGASDFIVKPFDPQVLETYFRNSLQRT